MLARLVAEAFRNLPVGVESNSVFEAHSGRHAFALKLAAKRITVSDPCTLEEFRTLPLNVAQELCSVLVPTYGDVFRDLQQVYGSKQAMLTGIDFQRFSDAEPDVAHMFIACLLIEGRITQVLTTNWDRLIEKAIARNTSKPCSETAKVVIDDPSWLDRFTGPPVIFAKIHGCATQYPTNCDEIVITTTDLHIAAAPGWRHDAVHDILSRRVLFCGYSASDYTLMVPAKVIADLRSRAALPNAEYFVAHDADLPAGARELTGTSADYHLRMYANDMFASLYFAAMKKRFENAITTAEQQTQPERAFFKWNDAIWRQALDRVQILVSNELAAFLEATIGPSASRSYDDSVSNLPIDLAHLRQLFLEGLVRQRGIYVPFRFDPVKDIVLLIIMAAVIDVARAANLTLSVESSFAGITITEVGGVKRKIMLVHGTYVGSVEPMVHEYVSDIENVDGRFPTFEVLVIPCNQYTVGKYPASAPAPVLSKRLPGTHATKRTFIKPDGVFGTNDFANLVLHLRAQLGV
jgi:hypothetical protein